MKNWKIFVVIFVFSGFLLACKGSKCDCPNFKPKSEIHIKQLQEAFIVSGVNFV
jgi:hypothetical protein